MARVDDDFRALPLDSCADAAMGAAAGAEHAQVRVERIQGHSIRLRDGSVEGTSDDTDLGVSVRVVHNGAWGFAASGSVTPDAAASCARLAVEMAQACAPMTPDRVELLEEPAATGEWVSAYELDPFEVDLQARLRRLQELAAMAAGPGVDHIDASYSAAKDQWFYADNHGSRTLQQRVRVHPALTVMRIGESGMESMRTLAPPAGRGWEYLTGTGWDAEAEIAGLGELLAEKVSAPSVEAGVYDLLIHPSNLWLTIHESVGHATELDRALGYEANYAGTSFATPDGLGSLRYGSPLMHVTGDRTVPHGLATVAWDAEGVAAQQWDLVTDGTLVGYQVDRQIAAKTGMARSNGCAYADSPSHVPMQRMANVSLMPGADDLNWDDLISGLDDGIAVIGDKSWSIDMQRFNFQFTGQRFYRIKGGQVRGQVKDVAYQATTTDFWGSLSRLGGPGTYVLGGAFNCGKGQPGQVAPVSHGTPAAVFTGVNVLNTRQEGGK